MTDVEKKHLYLTGIDGILQPLSFQRRKNGNDWRHRIDDRNELWANINFGRAVVNPSFGIKYLDFDHMLPKHVRSVTGTLVVLRSLLPPTDIYLIDAGPDAVARDLSETGLPFLSRLANRTFAIERLASDTVRHWPTPSYSDRIRVLPLLLAAEYRIAEACQFLKRFLVEGLPQDQVIPTYDVFADAFTKRFAC